MPKKRKAAMAENALRRVSIEDIARYVAPLTMYDNAVMRCVFSNTENYPLLEYIIKLLTKKELSVVNVSIVRTEVEHLIKLSAESKDLFMDVVAEDAEGNRYDFEIQRSAGAMSERRMRFYSSSQDYEMLYESGDYRELKDGFLIVLCEKDMYGKGEAYYTLDRRIVGSSGKDYGEAGDGGHIIVVNGQYRGDDELGRLLEDLSKANPDEMLNVHVKRAMSRLKKETKAMRSLFYESRIIDPKELEDRYNFGYSVGEKIGASSTKNEIILNMHAKGCSMELIADCTNVPVEKVASVIEESKNPESDWYDEED